MSLRVFLSSTGADLELHRKAVEDAILRRGWQIEAMRHFGADPRRNLAMCREKVAGCDVIVVVVAHSYGTPVPLTEEGDGEHSYTWYELAHAEALVRPIFGYEARDEGWSGPREAARIDPVNDPSGVEGIVARVKLLQELKARLHPRSRGTFLTPDQLATGVVADLSRWEEEHAGATTRVVQWEPCHAHALQPAREFAGREGTLAQLEAWWQEAASPDRVFALVAAGGTGKTAVVQRVVARLRRPPGGAGLFVWSFYEAPEVDRFLREAASYFLGREVTGGGAIEQLKEGLRGGLPHLLVLDGLERVQAEGEAGKVRGELLDSQLKGFLRLVAGGSLGRTRVLVTTRFPLKDLEPWKGAGYQPLALVDLEPAAARAVLRQWGVRGGDGVLDGLAERVGRHALSVAVLGSFVGQLGGGDPAVVDQLDLEQVGASDPTTARLARLLAYYREKLTPAERQVMGWLSVYPRGMSVQLMWVLIQEGKAVAGVLANCEQWRLVQVLQRLGELGLVYAYGEGRDVRWSAHPFLREHFAKLLGVPAEEVFEVVRRELSEGLEKRPGKLPTEAAELDRYEAWIEAAVGAGKVEEAFELFWFGLGGYAHLGKWRGEYSRGLRLVERMGAVALQAGVGVGLSEDLRASLLSSWGLFHLALGDLSGAAVCLERGAVSDRSRRNAMEESAGWQGITEVHRVRGNLPTAQGTAERAVAVAVRAEDRRSTKYSLAYLASTQALQGRLQAARPAFARATEIEGRPLFSSRGIDEADLHLRLGDRLRALAQTRANLATCEEHDWGRDAALCHDLLARCHLPGDPAGARPHLAALRAWAHRTGEVEMVLRAHHVAAALALAEGDPMAALAETDEGLNLARTHGYGLLEIDLGLVAARAALALPDARRALGHARAALDAATDSECNYAWGAADAGHLCGLAHTALGEADLARMRLTAALELRRRIEHPGADETREALKRLPAART